MRRAITVLMVGGGTACASAGTVREAGVQLRPIERDMIVASIQRVAVGFPDTAAVCIQVLGGPDGPTPPDSTLLSRISGKRRAVAAAHCPATYERMWIPPNDPLGPRPAGYVDPHYVQIGRPQFGQPRYAWIYLRLQQGTSGEAWICNAQQSGEEPVSATCRQIERWLN